MQNKGPARFCPTSRQMCPFGPMLFATHLLSHSSPLADCDNRQQVGLLFSCEQNMSTTTRETRQHTQTQQREESTEENYEDEGSEIKANVVQQRQTQYHPLHAASIAFNNLAVALLERCEYLEALDAMKDSIFLLEIYCRHTKNISRQRDDDILSNETVHTKLVEASRRCVPFHEKSSSAVASTRASATAVQPQPNLPCSDDNRNDLSCRNFQADDLSAIWTAAIASRRSTLPLPHLNTRRPPPKFIYPIRIDECLAGFGEPDFESAVRFVFTFIVRCILKMVLLLMQAQRRGLSHVR